MLLTNDGELAHRLTHPSFGVSKTYMAEIPGPVPRDLGRRLQGRRRAGRRARPRSTRSSVVDVHNQRAVVEVVLHEGRKHIVRRLLAAVDHPVSRLVRTQDRRRAARSSAPRHAAQTEPGGDRAAVQGGRAVRRQRASIAAERSDTVPAAVPVRDRDRRAGGHGQVDDRASGGAGARRRLPGHRRAVPDRHARRCWRPGSTPPTTLPCPPCCRRIELVPPVDPENQRHLARRARRQRRDPRSRRHARRHARSRRTLRCGRFLLDRQRRIAHSGRMVVEGRDIGTVIAPDAHAEDLSDRGRRRPRAIGGIAQNRADEGRSRGDVDDGGGAGPAPARRARLDPPARPTAGRGGRRGDRLLRHGRRRGRRHGAETRCRAGDLVTPGSFGARPARFRHLGGEHDPTPPQPGRKGIDRGRRIGNRVVRAAVSDAGRGHGPGPGLRTGGVRRQSPELHGRRCAVRPAAPAGVVPDQGRGGAAAHSAGC